MMRFNVGGDFLELPANFSLQLKKSNILFAFDNIALERTTSFSVPATPHNTGIFGWSNDFHYYGEKGRKRMQAQLQMDGVTKDGYLYITKYTPDAFECVFVTGELLGLADIKALGDWSQFILPANGVSLDADVRIVSSGNDYSVARVDYKTDGEIMPSFKLASFAEMALRQSGVMIDWGEVLDRIANHRIVLGKAKGVTETPCMLTRGYVAEQTTETPYPVLNSMLMDDSGELVGVITNEQSDYPIFKVKTDDAVQYYGYVQQWIARQDLTLSFADDTPDTLFLASAQMNGTFSFLGGYEFAADGTVTGEPLAGREIELQTGQTFLLISQNDYLYPGVGEFEGWTIANETLTANVVVKGADEQPNNAYIRVKDNVPAMTIVELLKTCAALSGTILSYRAGEVVFVEDIAGGAFRELDKPLKWKNLTRGVADYAQRNTIAFASDENVLSSEKIVATYAIDNVNIAEAKELLVLPFSEGQDSTGVLYIGSAFDGYTLGTWNTEKSNTYLSRVEIPLNASLQSVLEQGTSIVAEVKMTEQKFDTLKNDMVLFFEHSAWVWTSGIWSNGVAQMSLSRVSVDSIKPLPPRIPLEYQEIKSVGAKSSAINESIKFDTSQLTTRCAIEGYTEIKVQALTGINELIYVNSIVGAATNNRTGACEDSSLGGVKLHSYSYIYSVDAYFNFQVLNPEVMLIKYKTEYQPGYGTRRNHTLMTIETEKGERLFMQTTGCDTSTNIYELDLNRNRYPETWADVCVEPLFAISTLKILWLGRDFGFNYNIFHRAFTADKDGNILEEVIPCYRKSDLAFGLYYTKQNIFSVAASGNIGAVVLGDDVVYDRPWE